MQHCLPCKASSQGYIWYPVGKTNMVRLRIGLHGNHSALSKSATPPLMSKLNRPDQYCEISHDRFKKHQNTQHWRTGLNEKKHGSTNQGILNSNVWLHFVLFSPSSLILWHFLFTISVHIQWSSQKSRGTVPWSKLHLLFFRSCFKDSCANLLYDDFSLNVRMAERMVKSWKRSLKVIPIPGGF